MKDVYYFPHDYQAHNDPKCSALIRDFGMEGYGIYWCMIEVLHEQGGKIKKFPKLFDGLAYQFRVDKDILVKQIEAMLHQYELLLQDDCYIWSDRVLKNLADRKAKYEAKARAGQIGGRKSGEVRSKTKHCLKQNEANEQKERKEKERKEKEIKEKERKDTASEDLVKSEAFLKCFGHYLDMRIKIKKPMTEHARSLVLKDLERLAPNNEELQIKILEQSIQNSWQGVFELRPQGGGYVRANRPVESNKHTTTEPDKYDGIEHRDK